MDAAPQLLAEKEVAEPGALVEDADVVMAELDELDARRSCPLGVVPGSLLRSLSMGDPSSVMGDLVIRFVIHWVSAYDTPRITDASFIWAFIR